VDFASAGGNDPENDLYTVFIPEKCNWLCSCKGFSWKISICRWNKLDLWKTEKSDRRKKRRYLSKSPFFGITACRNAIFSRPDLFRPLHLSVQVNLEPVDHFFQKRTGFCTVYTHWSLGDDGKLVFPVVCRGLLSCLETRLCNHIRCNIFRNSCQDVC
jgi:hypothetical protein